MRGKKNVGVYDQDQEVDMVKRPKMMGFHGMRGKRSINYYGKSQFNNFFLTISFSFYNCWSSVFKRKFDKAMTA